MLQAAPIVAFFIFDDLQQSMNLTIHCDFLELPCDILGVQKANLVDVQR